MRIGSKIGGSIAKCNFLASPKCPKWRLCGPVPRQDGRAGPCPPPGTNTENKAHVLVLESSGFRILWIGVSVFVTNLLINIDHVATLRNARAETFPDPVHAAAHCEQAGADGIVFHLREDRRHITERDARLLGKTVQGKLDFELSTEAEVVSICCDVSPDLATLVPERREEVTTEGGLDVAANGARLAEVIPRLYDAGVEQVSLFVDPVPAQIEAAAESGANCVELHTGDFAEADTDATRRNEARRLAAGAEAAHEAGLRVHAGHGLDYNNFPLFQNTVPHVAEVSIGFSVMARAILGGMESAVRDMSATVKGSRA